MSGRWELRFEGMPPNPNARLHHMARARSAKHWRQIAYYLALSELRRERIPQLERARLSLVFTRRTVGRADEDNDLARAKPLVDGLVDAGILPDDTRAHVEWGTVLEEKGRPGVRLVIEALGGAEGA